MIEGLRAFRRPRLWLRAWFAMMALTLVVCLLPMPTLPLTVVHGDKLEHFIGYALLSAYAGMLFEVVRMRRWAYAVLLALGALIEGLQTFVPWRSGGDLADMAANALGVAIGMIVASTPLRYALLRFERLVVPA